MVSPNAARYSDFPFGSTYPREIQVTVFPLYLHTTVGNRLLPCVLKTASSSCFTRAIVFLLWFAARLARPRVITNCKNRTFQLAVKTPRIPRRTQFIPCPPSKPAQLRETLPCILDSKANHPFPCRQRTRESAHRRRGHSFSSCTKPRYRSSRRDSPGCRCNTQLRENSPCTSDRQSRRPFRSSRRRFRRYID